VPASSFSRLLDRVVDSGLVPDAVLRAAIRAIARQRLAEEQRGGPAAIAERHRARLRAWGDGPIALETGAANQQHYEVPPAFFAAVLGPRRKYSCCLFPTGRESLGEAEEAMLALTAERAGVGDGQDILDLGCGWGAFALWAAERYPRARILAVSNSAAQRQHIVAAALARGLANLEVVTADINAFSPGRRFDRVVSVEMLEHVRNHRRLLRRIAGWLQPGGRLFVHVFAHRRFTYPFESRDGSDWMARNFFSGGMMPAVDHLPSFQEHLALEEKWLVEGRHYARTAEAWLENLDDRRPQVLAALAAASSAGAHVALVRWRVFFMACAELFAYRGGREWMVAHYRFAARPA